MAISEAEATRAEYESLRSEIVTRISLRQQVLSLWLAFAGAVLGFATTQDASRLALVYPPLAAFMALVWHQNDRNIRRIAKYIRKNLEEGTAFAWETYLTKEREGRPRITAWAHVGMLLCTQIIAGGIGLAPFLEGTPTPQFIDKFLMACTFISVIIVMLLIPFAGHVSDSNSEASDRPGAGAPRAPITPTYRK